MLHVLKPATWMAVVLVACTGLAGIAWQNNPSTKQPQHLQDTLPKEKRERATKEKTVIKGDLDKAIEEVKKAQDNLELQLQNKDWEKMQRNLKESLEKINVEKIEAEIENAIKNIDAQKIQAKIQAELKQVDWEKMQKDLQKAQAELKYNLESGKMQADIQRAMEETKKTMAEMKTVDMEKVQAGLEKAQAELKNIDGPKMQAEMQRTMEETKKAMAEMKAVDMEKIQYQLEKAKEEMRANQGKLKQDMERARKEINENLKKDFRKEMEKAKEEVNQAAIELQNYKDMLLEMDKDGLLNAKEPYSIEYNKGTLIINGKTQPGTISTKYRHYFKRENVKISRGKDDDDRTIDL